MDYYLLVHENSPTIFTYFETGLIENLDAFITFVSFMGAYDASIWWTFPSTLRKKILQWFNRPLIIPSEDGMNFQLSWSITLWHQRIVKNLSDTRKIETKNESLRDLLTKFYKRRYLVPNLDPKVKLHLVCGAIRVRIPLLKSTLTSHTWVG